jgi:hypothetical protein
MEQTDEEVLGFDSQMVSADSELEGVCGAQQHRYPRRHRQILDGYDLGVALHFLAYHGMNSDDFWATTVLSFPGYGQLFSQITAHCSSTLAKSHEGGRTCDRPIW